MVSTCLQISKSYSPSTNPLGIVPSSPTRIGITVIQFPLQGPDIYLSFRFHFYSVVSLDGKVHYSAGSLFFLLIIIVCSCLAEIWWLLLLLLLL